MFTESLGCPPPLPSSRGPRPVRTHVVSRQRCAFVGARLTHRRRGGGRRRGRRLRVTRRDLAEPPSIRSVLPQLPLQFSAYKKEEEGGCSRYFGGRGTARGRGVISSSPLPSLSFSSLSSPAILSRWSAQQERKAQARGGRASLGCACELEGGG